MITDQMIHRIHTSVREKLVQDSTGHDYYHVVRVANLGSQFAQIEGADLNICFAAGLLHDYCHPEEKKYGTPHWGREALMMIGQVLQKAEVEDADQALIMEFIAEHESYRFLGGHSPAALESQILQDADRIEALGAIGIARVFMYAGAYGNPMYTPDEELGKWRPDPSVKQSAITHFYEKLLKLYDEMHTQTGKKIAAERIDYMKAFLQQFEKEWSIMFS